MSRPLSKHWLVRTRESGGRSCLLLCGAAYLAWGGGAARPAGGGDLQLTEATCAVQHCHAREMVRGRSLMTRFSIVRIATVPFAAVLLMTGSIMPASAATKGNSNPDN